MHYAVSVLSGLAMTNVLDEQRRIAEARGLALLKETLVSQLDPARKR